MNKDQIFELSDEELDNVAGGKVYINANTGRLGFSTTGHIYAFQNCTFGQVRDLCESFIGRCATEEEYDAACVAALKANGWITEPLS